MRYTESVNRRRTDNKMANRKREKRTNTDLQKKHRKQKIELKDMLWSEFNPTVSKLIARFPLQT